MEGWLRFALGFASAFVVFIWRASAKWRDLETLKDKLGTDLDNLKEKLETIEGEMDELRSTTDRLTIQSAVAEALRKEKGK